ncbi:MAG: hypothetical protein U0946_00905 [Patescibacteria group bacterium]|nr:hypothetical protein [Patescibacteria group bacterium]
MNEQGLSPEEGIEEEMKEPTPQELAEACKEVLSEEDCQELAAMDIDEGIGYAFTLLLAAEEEPEQFLKEKGIICSPAPTISWKAGWWSVLTNER